MLSFLPFDLPQQAYAYWLDSTQRQILFWDTSRQRGENYCAYEKDKEQPEVLVFDAELILDARTNTPPVNYKLERILPNAGTPTDLSKRPVIIFDPRAAQGAGMSGMKKESQMGKALETGHPTYYVSFFTTPEETQTIEQVCDACIGFVRKVIEKHPQTPKPILLGNCQAGWQIALMLAIEPTLECPLFLAGAPLSYWAGSHGGNPMRYTSGIMGGSWTTALSADLGGDLFDSSYLIEGFEKNSPATAYWQKQYDMYATVDDKASDYLHFEKWWNSPVLFRTEEIRFIVERLFIGDELVQGTLTFSDNRKADLKNIKAPIFVLCSHHDVITSPAQALGWVLDLYKTDQELIVQGQVIIYRLEDKAGHLGLISSSSIAQTTYQRLFNDTVQIEELPAGIYEAVEDDTQDQFSYLPRTLDDIHAICPKDPDDEQRFKNVKDMSSMIQSSYDMCISPMVRSMTTKESAETIRSMQPLRMQLAAWEAQAPMTQMLEQLAPLVKTNRQNVSKDNVFWQMQETLSSTIHANMEAMNDMKDASIDHIFSTLYDQNWLK